MNSKWLPAMAFGALMIAFLGYLAWSAAALPERVASHFDWHGSPDDWMKRSNYLLVFGLMGVGVPLLVVGLFFVITLFPGAINIPRKDYWLAPERRAETLDWLLLQGLWFACLLVLFFAAVHWLVVQANSRVPVRLSQAVWLVLTLFLATMAGWMGAFFLRFGGRRQSVGPA